MSHNYVVVEKDFAKCEAVSFLLWRLLRCIIIKNQIFGVLFDVFRTLVILSESLSSAAVTFGKSKTRFCKLLKSVKEAEIIKLFPISKKGRVLMKLSLLFCMCIAPLS